MSKILQYIHQVRPLMAFAVKKQKYLNFNLQKIQIQKFKINWQLTKNDLYLIDLKNYYISKNENNWKQILKLKNQENNINQTQGSKFDEKLSQLNKHSAQQNVEEKVQDYISKNQEDVEQKVKDYIAKNLANENIQPILKSEDNNVKDWAGDKFVDSQEDNDFNKQHEMYESEKSVQINKDDSSKQVYEKINEALEQNQDILLYRHEDQPQDKECINDQQVIDSLPHFLQDLNEAKERYGEKSFEAYIKTCKIIEILVQVSKDNKLMKLLEDLYGSISNLILIHEDKLLQTGVPLERIYTRLADASAELKEYEKAIQLYEKVIIIREMIYGKDHPMQQQIPKILKQKSESQVKNDNFTLFANLANCYNETGELNKAEEFFKKSLEIRNSSIIRCELGEILNKTDQREKALEQYEMALHCQDLETNTEIIARKYLSDYYRSKNNYSKAMTHLMGIYDQLQILYKQNQNDQIKDQIGNVLSSMGECYFHSDNFNLAQKCLQDSLEIRKTTAPQSLEIGILNYFIGMCKIHMNQRFESLDYFKACAENLEKQNPADAFYYSFALNNIGEILEQIKEFEESKTYYAKCLEVRNEQFVPDGAHGQFREADQILELAQENVRRINYKLKIQ